MPEFLDPPITLKQRLPRHSVFLSARVRRANGKDSLHRVRDLSANGMRIDGAQGWGAAEQITVSVGILEQLPALVKWVRGDQAGLEFAHEINADDARGKVALSKRQQESASLRDQAAIPTAGWLPNLNSPYKK